MDRKIDIKDFFVSCGPTSTPLLKNQRVHLRNNEAKESRQDVVACLLESKEMWPVAFREVCQEYLGRLDVGLARDCLAETAKDGETRRAGRRGNARQRRRSDSRDRSRSMSPSGARGMKEGKWQSKADRARALVDHLLVNVDRLPERCLSRTDLDSEARDLLDSLAKKAGRLDEVDLSVVARALRLALERLGGLLPEDVSRQLGLLASLKTPAAVAAAQILLLHASTGSRALLAHLVRFFHLLSMQNRVHTSPMQLAAILRPSLLPEVADTDCRYIRLCVDVISLSDKIFGAPHDLLQILKDRINRRPAAVCAPLVLPNRPCPPVAATVTSAVAPSPARRIQDFFTHSKSAARLDPVVLTSIRKITSPEHAVRLDIAPSTVKRRSLLDKTKDIYQRSVSPFRKSKEYLLTDIYKPKKSRLSTK